MVHIKRAYESASTTDGTRVLVDRLWPRGVSKVKAQLDMWLKEIAPSSGLRVWFGHKPERLAEFSKRYTAELRDNPAVAELRKVIAEDHTVTLVYGAKDPTVNHAVVLQKFLAGPGTSAGSSGAAKAK